MTLLCDKARTLTDEFVSEFYMLYLSKGFKRRYLYLGSSPPRVKKDYI